MIKRCDICGREFVAQRRTAKYCSETCKKRHQRGSVVVPLKPVDIRYSMPEELVMKVVSDAHDVAGDLSRASMHTAAPLCTSLGRVARKLEDALRNEGL